MQVQNTTATSSRSTETASTSQIGSEMFLKLLVAQLQNQDPFQAQDPNQFMNQLVIFNQLDQTIQIRQLLEQNSAATNSSAAA